jgi:ribonuclease P protein component
VRNRLKRRIREFFRLNKESLPGSSDLVVMVREGSASLNFWQVSEELKGLFGGR